MGIPRSSYYEFINRKPSNLSKENELFKKEILAIYLESHRRYGAPKIREKMQKKGYQISLKRTQRLMRKLRIKSITVKKFRPKGKSDDSFDADNLLKQDFSTKSKNEKWLTDITYIHTSNDHWCYLASVIDCHTKEIIGHHFSKRMTTELAVKAVEDAYNNQKPKGITIIHSDRGTQYTSKKYRNTAKSLGLTVSYSAKGNPYDNAGIESFHSILKKEFVHHTTFKSYTDAKLALFKYIESWYNRERIHGSINYMTPHEYSSSLVA
jgi:transposase InsO family protein